MGILTKETRLIALVNAQRIRCVAATPLGFAQIDYCHGLVSTSMFERPAAFCAFNPRHLGALQPA